MSQPLRQTKRILEKISLTKQISEDAFVSLFVSIRRLIEKEKKQNLVPTLWFYCNWCMHPEVDRGLTKNWLTRISRVMGESPPSVWYTDQVASVMSLDKLRADLIRLFSWHKLNSFLFESLTNWKALLRRLCEHLIDTPLQRFDKSPPDSDHRFWIVKLQITLEDPGGQRPGEFNLAMDFHYDDVDGLYPDTSNKSDVKNGRMFMPVVVPEQPEVFRFP